MGNILSNFYGATRKELELAEEMNVIETLGRGAGEKVNADSDSEATTAKRQRSSPPFWERFLLRRRAEMLRARCRECSTVAQDLLVFVVYHRKDSTARMRCYLRRQDTATGVKVYHGGHAFRTTTRPVAYDMVDFCIFYEFLDALNDSVFILGEGKLPASIEVMEEQDTHLLEARFASGYQEAIADFLRFLYPVGLRAERTIKPTGVVVNFSKE
jgi:hypothetical protein